MQDDIVTLWTTLEDVANMTISYAQNFEDIMLIKAFGGAYAGYYVDVGANDPVFHSVTKLLSDRGWRGINIEPTPSLHARLVADRPRDLNLNVGISDTEGTLTFYEVPPPLHGWSTFMPKIAQAYRNQGVESIERPIPVVPLNRVFEHHVGDHVVDVLKIDAEGWEKQVISSLNLQRWRPRVILVEATWTAYWEHMILGANYIMAGFDGINRYYVRGEEPGLVPAFASPVSALDNVIPYHLARLLLREPVATSTGSDVKAKAEAVAGPEVFRRQSDAEILGPTTFSLALRIRDAARKNPRVAGVVKRILRLVG